MFLSWCEHQSDSCYKIFSSCWEYNVSAVFRCSCLGMSMKVPAVFRCSSSVCEHQSVCCIQMFSSWCEHQSGCCIQIFLLGKCWLTLVWASKCELYSDILAGQMLTYFGLSIKVWAVFINKMFLDLYRSQIRPYIVKIYLLLQILFLL